MDIRQLETFIYVSDLKSFSKAADRLFITQPTVTSHIQNLEKELGTLLINRIGKKLSLTEAGEILYEYAKEILNTIETATHTLLEHENKIEGHLNILSSSVPCIYYLPDKLKEFMNQHERVSFSISGIDSMNVINQIKNGQCDFGIVGYLNEDPALIYQEIFADEIFFVVSKSLIPYYKDYEEINLEEIEQIPLILREHGSGTLKTVQAKITPKSPQFFKRDYSTVDNNAALLKLIARGFGAGFVSNYIANELGKDLLKLKIHGVDLNRKFYLVFHKSKQLSPLAAAFLKFLAKSKK